MSQFQSIFSQRNSLKEENDQLKAKYKKSLQQLMHILKVNKSLKQYLDHNTQLAQQTAQQQINALKASHKQEVHSLAEQLEQITASLLHSQRTIQQYQLKMLLKEKQIQENEDVVKRLSRQIEQLKGTADQTINININDNQKNRLITENGELKGKVVKLLEALKQREMMERCGDQLRDKVKELSLQLMKEKEKSRHQMLHRQSQLIRVKQQQNFKLNTIQSKYQLLENQLHNYKSIEKYFEEQSKSIIDEEYIYNSIKEQITRINQDFNKYEEESSYLLLKKRQQNSQRNKKMIELEDQLSMYKQKELKYHSNHQKVEQLTKELSSIKNHLSSLQNQNNLLVKKSLVLQALNDTQKHRPSAAIAHHLLQFQQRINLLSLQQRDKAFRVDLRQLIMLKEHISQLSGLLSRSTKKQEALQRRLQGRKIKMQKMQSLYKQKIEEYRSKLRNYDTLISKLYDLIEQKLKEKMPQEIEAQFNLAISYYEQKMLLMSDEIIKLRNSSQQPSHPSSSHHVASSSHHVASSSRHTVEASQENQALKEMIANLSIQMKELGEQNDRLRQQNSGIAQLTLKLRQSESLIQMLSGQMSSLKNKGSCVTEMQVDRIKMSNYERQMQQLRRQVLIKQQQIQSLQKQSFSTTTLVEKINYLQFQLNKQELTHVENEKKLQKALRDMEIRLKTEQGKNKQLEFDKLQASDNYRLQEVEKLLKQNSELKARLQKVEASPSHAIKAGNFKDQYESLLQKVRDYEVRISDLEKGIQQSNVESKMQIKQLNSQIISLRTTNIALTNELQSKQDTIHQLKHQAYTHELRLQKERSSASFSRQSAADTSSDNNDKLLMIITLLSAEVEQLRLKKQQLEVMYHHDLDQYKQALKLLENKQMEICNSLQYSSHKDFKETLAKSEKEISLRFESNSKIGQGRNGQLLTESNVFGPLSSSKDRGSNVGEWQLVGGSEYSVRKGGLRKMI